MTANAGHADFANLFAPENQAAEAIAAPTWKVLLVDDDADMHAVLRLALQEVRVEGLALQLFDACSAIEAKGLLAAHPDIALALVDVVMETGQAGLDLVHYIRKELGNRMLQIILLTGQPGYAPQREVVEDYEIDGYRLKSELSAERIFVSVHVALRAYRTQRDLAQYRQHLETLVEERTTELQAASMHLSDTQFAMERAGIGIHWVDFETGQLLFVNRYAAALLGYSPEEMLGFSVPDIDPNFSRESFEAIKDGIRQQGHMQFETTQQTRDGRRIPLEMHIYFHVATALAPARFICFMTDISRRKEGEQALIQARDTAEAALNQAQALNRKLGEAQSQLLQSEKMASLGQLAAGVAHELNNPIGFVHCNLGTLEAYVRDLLDISSAWDEAASRCGDSGLFAEVEALEQKKQLDFLRQDIFPLLSESREGLDRVRKIVQDLKSFSRLGETSWQWADLHQGLDSTLNIVWNEIKYKCTVSKDYGALPVVMCVLSQLNQVFMNLLVNAAHAIEHQGEIRIRTGCRGEEVFVEISDNGSGIAPENLNRLFEPFFTTKAVGQGTGLGLSVSYSIVQKHHGRIDVNSTPGQGSTFTVWLPVQGCPDTAPE